jgi:hypothetical protein
MSNVLSYVPDVTPAGKPEKVGVCVATPAFIVTGSKSQQWICAAVVVPNKSENAASTLIVANVVSMVTNAEPLPGVTTGGDSDSPSRAKEYFNTSAKAGWRVRERMTARADKKVRIFMS